MKRTIELYIDGKRADLDASGLILMNYAFTDLEKPTAVKNSYSKQITLPGTPANDAIFGHFARTDRRIEAGGSASGVAFNPGFKTPFVIYNELGEAEESGYLRLDSVTRKGKIVTAYKCSLFGGLGDFFFALSYNEDGGKRTLADLDYLGTSNPDTELDFVINASAVSAAWSRVRNYPTALAQKWDVINFAPAYNGIPEGDFEPGKGIVSASSVGLPTSVTEDSKTYTTIDNKTIVNLGTPVDEWAAKDIRSYLQRPVLSMRAFLAAIANPANNGGYSVDYTQVPGNYYLTTWKTLPMLTSLGSGRRITGSVSIYDPQAQFTSGYQTGRLTIDGIIPQGMKTHSNLSIRPWMAVNTLYGTALENVWNDAIYHKRGSHLIAYFFQAVAYNGNQALGASNIKVVAARNWNWQSILDDAGVTFEYSGVGVDAAINNPVEVHTAAQDGRAYFRDVMNFEVETSFPPTNYKIFVHCLHITTQYINGEDPSGGEVYTGSGEPAQYAYGILHATSSNMNYTTAAKYWVADHGSSVAYESPDGIRSGAQINKALLLQSKYSPAEYLISFCKLNGLVFLCDQKEKHITILPRDYFFGEGKPVIDLTNRVDLGKDITITPLNLKSKWYELSGDLAQGAFAQEYNALYGVDFGIQRVNTGYDFDASAVNIMDGVVYRNAVTKLAHSRYWVMIAVSGQFRPSPFLDKGGTYTLWEQTTQEAKTFPVPGIPASATLSMYNIDHEYYDVDGSVLRLDLADKDGKPVDGEDILVRQSFGTSYSKFKISDDTAAMIALNNGKPCWDLSAGSGSIGIPTFAQFVPGDGADEYNITRSLNYGKPKELDIPGCSYSSNAGIYARFWRAFLADRLNQDTKVMKCRVDLSGMKVNQELLRRFYYYEGSLWVLNKISNYSITTWDPAECEFIQVRDIENYTDGQILD